MQRISKRKKEIVKEDSAKSFWEKACIANLFLKESDLLKICFTCFPLFHQVIVGLFGLVPQT